MNDLREAVVNEDQETELKNPGKIYFKDNYIFIVEELREYMYMIILIRLHR